MKAVEVTVKSSERMKADRFVNDLHKEVKIFAKMIGSNTFLVVTSNESGMAWFKANLPVVFDEEYSIKELK